MDLLHLFVSVPIACFRVAQAREYWETYPFPPPSTVYGMLLSVVGETNRFAHLGVELAVGLVTKPDRSVVLRNLWHVKSNKYGLGLGENARPDFQEILSGMSFSLWIRPGQLECSDPNLCQRLKIALSSPQQVTRFGGLSLRESTHLVDEIRYWRETDSSGARLLISDESGEITLPIWPDHVGAKGTRWGQFRLTKTTDVEPQPSDKRAWVNISPLKNI